MAAAARDIAVLGAGSTRRKIIDSIIMVI